MLILQVILITAIEGLRDKDKADEDVKRKLGWFPPDSNSSKVKALLLGLSIYNMPIIQIQISAGLHVDEAPLDLVGYISSIGKKGVMS